jgi:uncharacterized protein (DUF1015 family)
MPVVKPFKAVRPKKEYVKDVASVPYDVISEKEARAVKENNPLTFLRIGRPEINFPEGVDIYSEKVYQKGKEVIQEYLDKEILVQDQQECFYIYAQEVSGFRQVGLVSLVSAEDYDNDIIKKHELTREDKEKDRFNHILKTSAHAEPVFLACRDNKTIDSIMESFIHSHDPVYDFTTEDGVRNILWKVDDPGVNFALQTAFEKDIKALYIADGHHRAKASSLVANYKKKNNPEHTGEESYNFFLAVIFPSSQLRILPYNRVVKTSLSLEDIIEKASSEFEIRETKLQEPDYKGEFVMYGNGKAYVFKYKGPEIKEMENKLDVAILQNKILAPILGIENPRKDKNIDFVGGIKGVEYLKKVVDAGDYELAIVMYPTSIQELFDISDESKIMPPKSTWFEPKLKSGLFVHLIEE